MAGLTYQVKRRHTVSAIGGLVVGGLTLVTALLPVTTASALTPGAIVAQGTPSTAAVGSLWGTPTTGGTYTYPAGKNGNTATGSGVGDQGLIQMQPAMLGSAYLPGVSQRDITVTACFTVEQVATSGLGIRFSTVVRSAAKSSYRSMVLASPNGATTLSLVHDGATADANRTLAVSSPSTKISQGTKYCVDTEAEGTNPVLLRTRVYQAGTTPPAWQTTVSDTDAARITGAGSIGLIGYGSSGNVGVSRLRVSEFTAKALVDNQPAPPPVATGYGSAALGTTNYAIPADASKVIYVDPASGDPAADVKASDYLFDRTHTQIACNQKPDKAKFPLVARTTASLARAIKWVPNGGTIVMKSGTYHEQIMICEEKKFTIQAAPGAVVWLDGSVPVTGWRQEGTRWVKDGWTAKFDASRSFTWGAADGAGAWQFVGTDHPMAANPDQVFIDGKSLAQVASVDKVNANSFYVNYATGKIYLGVNPAGKQVRASDLQWALNFATPGNTVRGIGIRNYATSLPQQGAVRVLGPATGMAFENVIFENNASSGLMLGASAVSLTNLTARNNGIAGIFGHQVTGLKATNLSVTGNNTEFFNPAPSAAGIKFTHSSNISIANSEIAKNNAIGIWIDEDVHNFDILNNSIRENTAAGVTAEISFDGRIVNNVIRDNTEEGVTVFGTQNAKVWNNTITGSRHPLMVTQDARINPATGRPWPTRGTVVANNIVGNVPAGKSPWCPVVCVYDRTSKVPASTLVSTLAGNTYHRTAASNPAQLFRWPSDPAKHSTGYADLTSFRAATKLDPTAIELTGAVPLSSTGVASADLQGKSAQVAVAVPADIAGVLGVPAGSKVIGPVRK